MQLVGFIMRTFDFICVHTDVLIGSGVCTCQAAEYILALFTYKRNKFNTFGTTVKLRLIFRVSRQDESFTKNSNTLKRLRNILETANARNLPFAHTLCTSTQFHDTPLPCHHVTRNDVTPPESLAGVRKTKIRAGK